MLNSLLKIKSKWYYNSPMTNIFFVCRINWEEKMFSLFAQVFLWIFIYTNLMYKQMIAFVIRHMCIDCIRRDGNLCIRILTALYTLWSHLKSNFVIQSKGFSSHESLEWYKRFLRNLNIIFYLRHRHILLLENHKPLQLRKLKSIKCLHSERQWIWLLYMPVSVLTKQLKSVNAMNMPKIPLQVSNIALVNLTTNWIMSILIESFKIEIFIFFCSSLKNIYVNVLCVMLLHLFSQIA